MGRGHFLCFQHHGFTYVAAMNWAEAPSVQFSAGSLLLATEPSQDVSLYYQADVLTWEHI
jgi:hypothetical protein